MTCPECGNKELANDSTFGPETASENIYCPKCGWSAPAIIYY